MNHLALLHFSPAPKVSYRQHLNYSERISDLEYSFEAFKEELKFNDQVVVDFYFSRLDEAEQFRLSRKLIEYFLEVNVNSKLIIVSPIFSVSERIHRIQSLDDFICCNYSAAIEEILFNIKAIKKAS